MAVNMDLSSKALQEKKDSSYVHYIPCSTEYNGSADVEKFFKLTVTEGNEEEKKGLDARLRGYPLKGSEMKVPDGYSGVVLREAQAVEGEGSRVVRGVVRFDAFTYWNWDRQPSRSDKYQQALDWLEVASVIHGTKD